MLFPETTENRALADAAVSRLRAKARAENTRASLFRIGGYSVFTVCLGLGCSAILLGYASIKRAQSSSDEIAMVLSTAIRNASITAKGEVKLVPGATMAVEPNATVNLGTGASVTLEPGRNGEVQGTRPHFDPFANGPQPKSGGQVKTNYTVLKKVNFSKGAVMTAWTFTTGESTAPARQRCYYAERTDRGSAPAVVELAVNGKVVNQAGHQQINLMAASTNCVWFNAQGES